MVSSATAMASAGDRGRGGDMKGGSPGAGGSVLEGAKGGRSMGDSGRWLRLDDLHKDPGGKGFVRRVDGVPGGGRLLR
ncbi:unnamed protein product [Choristocarpus tenellus]